jgi:hypothetical protein
MLVSPGILHSSPIKWDQGFIDVGGGGGFGGLLSLDLNKPHY